MLLELPSEVLLVLLPGQVLILAQETLFTTSPTRALSRTRLHDHFFGGRPLHHNRTPAIRICGRHQCARDFPCQRPWPMNRTNTQRPYRTSTTVLFNAVVLGSMSQLSALVDAIQRGP